MSIPQPPFLPHTEPPPPEPQPRRRLAAALFLLVFYVLSVGFVGAHHANQSPSPQEETLLPKTVEGLLKLAAGELIFFGLLFVVAAALGRLTPTQLFIRWNSGLKPIWRGIGWSLFLRGIIAVVLAVLTLGIASNSDPKTAVDSLRPKTEVVVDPSALVSNPLYLALSLTLISFVVAGFREELWRAGILALLAKLYPLSFASKRGQAKAVLFAAVIFGLGHLPQGLGGAFITMLLGIGLGLLIVRYQSIWEAVLAHGFFNATTFLALYWIAKHNPALLP